MHFANPNLLLHALWLLPGILLLAWWGERRRRHKLSQWVANTALADTLTSTVSRTRRRWRLILLMAAMGLLIVAVARPQWGTQLVRSPSHSRDVLVVLDTSRSMLARDIPPSRLQHAKYLIRQLIQQFPGDRFGLVLFAGEAFLECPLTQNRSGFLLFLDEADTESIPRGGTNLQAALETALKAFGGAESTHQGVLLITDGDELEGDVTTVLDSFRELKVPIFVVGIGDPVLGSYIQMDGNKFVTDADGNRARTKLNEEGLQRISKAVGGSYVRSTVAYDGSDHLVQKIRGLIPDDQQAESSVRPIERYQVPLFLALLLALVRLGLGERRQAIAQPRRLEASLPRAAVAIGVVMAVLATTPAGHAQDDESGRGGVADASGQLAPAVPAQPSPEEELAMQRDQLAERLIDSYQQRLEKARTPLEQAFCHYNLGVACQQAGEMERAASHFQQAIDLAPELTELTSRAYQNLGVLKHQAALAELQAKPDAAIDQLTQAQQNYREAMRLAADPTAVATDHELALRHQEIARQIKKLQEQMARQQQEAKESLDKAVEEQQQANQAQDQRERQEKQDQSMKDNQAAQQKLQEASEQARQAGLEQAADQAEQVRKQLEEAEEKQQEAMNRHRSEAERQQAAREAEEKLEEAQQQLAGRPGEEGEGEQQQAEAGKPADDAGQEDGQQQSAAEPPGEQPPADREPAAGQSEAAEFDKQQAMRILEEMEKAEGGDVTREIKRNMRANTQLNEPARNW